MTASVPVSNAETVPSSKLVTYACVPAGLTAKPVGLLPTLMLPVTVLVLVSSTETASPPKLETYAFGPAAAWAGSLSAATPVSARAPPAASEVSRRAQRERERRGLESAETMGLPPHRIRTLAADPKDPGTGSGAVAQAPPPAIHSTTQRQSPRTSRIAPPAAPSPLGDMTRTSRTTAAATGTRRSHPARTPTERRPASHGNLPASSPTPERNHRSCPHSVRSWPSGNLTPCTRGW